MPLDSNTNLYENETIKKIEELSQTEINNIKDVKLVFKYLSDCNNLINKIQQLQKELEELKEKFIEFNFKDDGESIKNEERLKEIKDYIKKLNLVMKPILELNFNFSVFLLRIKIQKN